MERFFTYLYRALLRITKPSIIDNTSESRLKIWVEKNNRRPPCLKAKKFRRTTFMQMELLGHSFFVFINVDSDMINIVYKRKNGTYGIIEPEN
ncbi:MAG TPA: hypothetical protein DIC60_01780 [Lachnospiraceae bacterium]|nr:hypothetical protein [Lachnospiraceae bacterium]